MPIRRSAAPPTPWSRDLAMPVVDDTAYIHSYSHVIGDVRIGPGVLIAPGCSIRADEGTPFYIGEDTNIQDGVVIHGLEQGRVTGDDGQQYSVWIGSRTSITHKALIHGPAFVGDECFIGFRSTVFNAKIGDGCIVMMHVLVENVEIPPGRFVPSGSVITTQQQADRLPEVQESDKAFAHHIIGINDALREGYMCVENNQCITTFKAELINAHQTSSGSFNHVKDQESIMGLSADALQQVRQLLAGGYRIGAEHVDERRFRSGSWKSCAPIQSSSEYQVLAELEACLQDHAGEYVRVFGIDPKNKRRVMENIIQRPGDKPVAVTHAQPSNASNGRPSYSASPASSANLAGDLRQQVQQLLQQGYRIGTEFANPRQYKASAWRSGATIQSSRDTDVVAALEAFMSEHEGEYVRLIGIDPKAKRRVAEVLIQQPGGRVSAPSQSSGRSAASSSSQSSTANGAVGSSLQQQVQQLLNQGYRIGTEHVDSRRFRVGSWQSCSPIQATNSSEAFTALTNCLREHQGEYVRMFGIDPKNKRRVMETIIQRPDGQTANGATSSAAPAPSTHSHRPQPSASNGRFSSDLRQQVQQLLQQGYRIGTEFANPRQYKASAWRSGATIQAGREAEVLAELEAFVTEHEGEYIRLIGIDPKAKRRVTELLIQQPGGKV